MTARLALLLGLALCCLAATAAEPARVALRANAAASQRSESALAAAFSARAGERLVPFGYDLFTGAAAGAARSRTPAGAVRDDYELGPGDVLSVTLHGPQPSSRRLVVDAEGRLLADTLPRPFAAAGRTLGDLRREVEAAVKAASSATQVFLSLAELRSIAVVITGAVVAPGRRELTSFDTVLDALVAAGGVRPDGSLRRISLIGSDGTHTVDLYDLTFTGGGLAARRLRDGDRLVVPTIGATVGVAGPVKRPGVFELPAGRQRASLAELREMAGGLIRPGTPRALRLGLAADGRETADEVTDPDAPLFGDGDLLMLAPRREDRRGVVRLEGHVRRPGPRALASTRTLIDLVGEADLGPDPYRAFAVLAGHDRTTGARTLQAVDLAAVLEGRGDRPLADEDTLIVLGAGDVEFLTATAVLDLLRTPAPAPEGTCAGLVVLARALTAQPHGTLAAGPQARAAAELAGADRPCPELFERFPDLLLFALQRSVLVRTGVARPGFYPVAGGAGAARAAERAAGATAREAPRLSGPAEPGSVLDTHGPSVELVGHVRFPGVRPLGAARTLRAALDRGEALEPGVYPLMGILERFDRATLLSTPIAFSPQDVAAGRADRTLADRDRLHIFSAAAVRALLAPATGDPRGPATPVRATAASPATPDPPRPAVPAAVPEEATAAPAVDPAFAALLIERAVQVRGAVRSPGAYPVADSVSLEGLIAAAGGLSGSADPASVEITSAGPPAGRRMADLSRPEDRRLRLLAGDAVRVNPLPAALEARAVTILGEVRRPGAYDVLRGERLSQLIARAGGLTDDAYPAGTVFLRESERRRQRGEFEQRALAIERDIVIAERSGSEPSEKRTTLARRLATELRGVEPPGRIVVEADPGVLRSRPELDPLLEPDDRIVVPKRPSTVLVAGEVNNPGAVQFLAGRDADGYIRDAGGLTGNADEGRIYLVHPNGRAEPLHLSGWNHSVRVVPPGALLVVPFDADVFGALSLKDIGGILGQIAVTAASISVITR